MTYGYGYDDYTLDREGINRVQTFTIVIASVSILFPLSVVVILIQRYKTLVIGKSLMHYVMFIAIADTINAFTIALGYPDRGPLCSLQGFLYFFFTRMSWFYTDVLIVQLFFVVLFKKYFLNKKYMHIIVWSVNVVLQILPFVTKSMYGTDDGGENFIICGLGKGKGSTTALYYWNQYALNIELLASFGIIIILSFIIVCYSLHMKNIQTPHVLLIQRIRESWSIVILYPCAMLIAWVPSTIYGFYSSVLINEKGFPDHYFVTYNYLASLNVLYGPLLALIFYTKTLDARRAWIYNLRCILHVTADVDIDERSSCSSIISIQDIEMSNSSYRTQSAVSMLINRLWGGSYRKDPNNLLNVQQVEGVNPISNAVRIPEAL